MIYLDSAATTKPCEQAADAILSAMQNSFGNASSLHGMGIRSEKIIASAKKTLLAKLGEGDIIFTSGATESNNTALLGAAETYKRSGDRIVTTAIEHPSVANVMTKLEERGFHVERLAPKDHPDFVQALADAVDEHTVLVSCMAVNNETGFANDVKAGQAEESENHRTYRRSSGIPESPAGRRPYQHFRPQDTRKQRYRRALYQKGHTHFPAAGRRRSAEEPPQRHRAGGAHRRT